MDKMLRTSLPNLTVIGRVTIWLSRISKTEIFVLMMTSSIFHFVADTPGTKIISSLWCWKKVTHIFMRYESFKDGISIKNYFLFQNWRMTDHLCGVPRLQSSNNVICSANKGCGGDRIAWGGDVAGGQTAVEVVGLDQGQFLCSF